MRHSRIWLLATALLALLLPCSLVAAEEAHVAGSVEAGAVGMGVSNDVKRANEYTAIRPDQGAGAYGRAGIEAAGNGMEIEADGEFMSSRDQKYDLDVDLNRIMKFEGEYQTFQHWLDHDRLDWARATMKNTNASPNPSIYSEDLVPDKDFMIVHREWENEAALTLPQLPSVTFKAGFRMEEREGVEQAIGMSHCSSCHVVGQAKDVNERTEDLTLGATGKFGLVTIDYEYLDRRFSERATAPTFSYNEAGSPKAPFTPSAGLNARVPYGGEELPYHATPDSEKESHLVKVRIDLPRQTSLSGSYVNASVESEKDGDVSYTLNKGRLENDYSAYSAKVSTKLGKSLNLSLGGRIEDLDGDKYQVNFFDNTGAFVTTKDFESEESRDVTTLTANALYRLGRRASLRLGYEYEEVDRTVEDLGETKTHTAKLALRVRPSKTLSGRISYEYQDIEDPLMNGAGTKGPINATFDYGTDPKAWYGTDFYTQRIADATNLPEEVQEGKFSFTWTPTARFSATVYARYRTEENELNFSTYQQDSYSPGLSLWLAPVDSLNLTMAYAFDKQRTENQMCVGWYHG